MTTCTVVVAAYGRRCGEPAVSEFRASEGEPLGECSEHLLTIHRVAKPAPAAHKGLCRRAVCVDLAGGYDRVDHYAGVHCG